MRAARQVAVDRGVEALQPHVRVARVQPALVLEELRRRLVVDAREGEGRRAVRARVGRHLGDDRVRRRLVRAREVVDGRRLLDVARAVDRAHLEGEEALLHRAAPTTGSRRRPTAPRAGSDPRARWARAASVSSISRSRHSNWRSSTDVLSSLPVNVNAVVSSRVLERPAQVLALRRLVVGVRRVADVLERADVALAVLRALDAALVGLRTRRDALVDREALAKHAVRERRAAVVGDRVELRVAAAVAPSLIVSLLVGGWFRKHAVFVGSMISSGIVRLLADAAAVEVAALGVDVPVAAAALEAAADDRVPRDDRAVRLRRDLGHEVGLDDADAAAHRAPSCARSCRSRGAPRRPRRGRCPPPATAALLPEMVVFSSSRRRRPC